MKKALILVVLLSTLFAAEAGKLTVTILGLKSNEGTVKVALYDKEKSYNDIKDKSGGPLKAVAAKPEKSQAVAVFENIPNGEYAIKLYHDSNANGKLDFNGFLPAENYGFSNNAMGLFGPPDWNASKFKFDDKNQTIEITVK